MYRKAQIPGGGRLCLIWAHKKMRKEAPDSLQDEDKTGDEEDEWQDDNDFGDDEDEGDYEEEYLEDGDNDTDEDGVKGDND